jgi:hypothetical protein
VRDLLSKLSARNYDDKESRKEIFALLGELTGRLKPFANMTPSLEKCYQDLEVLLTAKTKVTEPSKRRLLTEIEVALDSIGFETVKEFLSRGNGCCAPNGQILVQLFCNWLVSRSEC